MDFFVDIHTHKTLLQEGEIGSYRLGCECAPPCGSFSAGIHPWDAETEGAEVLLQQLQGIECVAIGEIGLDWACSVDKERQRWLFEQQLSLAQERNLPIVLHCVKAYNEVEKILQNYHLKAVIFHGFIGSATQALALTRHGYYLSFGFGALRSPKTLKALGVIERKRVLLESDTTTTYPIELLYEGISTLLGTTSEVLKQEIYDNYKRIF